MILCPAQIFDIPTIMTIERSAFIPQIQEKQRVFEQRLQFFPQGFLVLADTSEETVCKHGSALIAGYLTSELWESLPDFSEGKAQEKALQKQFALGHSMRKTFCKTGSVLYISSFALLRQYQGHALGEPFFRAALTSLCSPFPQVHTIVLLVCAEWQGAKHIYEKAGFTDRCTLHNFFPSLHTKHADGIIMTASADAFRSEPPAIKTVLF